MNWQIVQALGPWAGAIATTCAVILALRTSRDASAIRVKVKVTMGCFVQGPGISDAAVFFSATNIGQRPVKLTSFGILMSNGQQLVFPDTRGALPANLQESDYTQYSLPAKELANSLRNYSLKGTVKLRIYFSDTHDVRHWTKWKFKIDEWIKV